jgi:ABC-type Zn2+ transport system substrate-binding protein/surface adhesin
MKSSLLIGSVLFLSLVSCRQQQAVDPLLTEALQIQDEAIHTGMSVDSLISIRIGADTSSANIKKLNKWAERVALWRESMVTIPGVEPIHNHDHDHGHDHDHDHTHEHQGASVAEGLSPAEIKQVQLGWKAEIEAIRDSVR